MLGKFGSVFNRKYFWVDRLKTEDGRLKAEGRRPLGKSCVMIDVLQASASRYLLLRFGLIAVKQADAVFTNVNGLARLCNKGDAG